MRRILPVLAQIVLLCLISGSCKFIKATSLKDNLTEDSTQNHEHTTETGQPANYYVSNDGDDDNSGLSPKEAWRSIAKVNKAVLAPGTTVFFKRGDEWRETLIVEEEGTSDSYVSFSSYGTGAKPIINGADYVVGWVKKPKKIWTADCPKVPDYFGLPYDYIVIANGRLYERVGGLDELDNDGEFFLENNPGRDRISIYSEIAPDSLKTEVSARMFGICVADKAYISLKNLELRNCAHSGAFFMSTSEKAGFDGNCIIDSCDFFRNRITGIIFDNGYSNNTVRNCISTYNGNGFYCSSDQKWGSDRNVFIKCYSGNNINHTKGLYSDGHGFGIWNSDDNIIEYCESYNDKYGIVIDPNNRDNDIIIRYNYIHNTQKRSPGINVGGNTPEGTLHQVYYNLIVNTGAGEDGYAIWVYGRSRKGEVHICNNTIFQDGNTTHSAFGIMATAGNDLTLKNNIVFSEGKYPFAVLYLGSGLSETHISNNVYYTPNCDREIFFLTGMISADIVEWQKLTNSEVNSRKTDPLFVKKGSDFSLGKNSPCINAGAHLEYKTDILGNPVVGSPDIGCFEKQ